MATCLFTAMTDVRYQTGMAEWAVDADALRRVRQSVFIDEQQVPAADEWDGLDASCQHALARDTHGNVIATGRLTPQHGIGRMAVLREWRRRGVGSAILMELIEQARRNGWARLSMHAQTHAVPFYERHGFHVTGEAFDECGIAHRHMYMNLDAGTPAAAPIWQTDTRESLAGAMIELLDATERRVSIYSRELDRGLLDQRHIVAAIKRIAISGRGAAIRILVHDIDSAIHEDHALLGLAQRLTSAIQLRRPREPADRAYASAFLLNDRGGYLLRPLATRFEAHGETDARSRAAPLAEYFDAVWERSEICTELRLLDL